MPPRLKSHECDLASATDESWMRRALVLAQRVPLLQIAPNPRVGCVIAKDGRLITQYAHLRFGGLHAEAAALEKAGNHAKGATAYLTLEPCCHSEKKTPPCAQALIRAGIARVVIACRDENPKVNGRGIRLLKKAGIKVADGILEAEARQLNRFFFHWIRTGRPWVTLKMASSLDGRITASTRWLSNTQSLQFVQRLRAEHDAILAGKDTVLLDNPRLTLRTRGKATAMQPLRIVLDSRLALAHHRDKLRILRNGPLLVACTPNAKDADRNAMQDAGTEVWTSRDSDPNGHVPLDELLEYLGRRGIRSILVEGGAQTATAFLEQNHVDDAWFFLAPTLAGAQRTPLFLGKEIRFQDAEVHALGDNVLVHVRITRSARAYRRRQLPLKR